MDLHKSYKKEDILGKEGNEENTESDAKKETFIWAYVIRPVHGEERK